MFAVIKTGGKQYRVAANDVLKIEKVAGEVGDIVEIGQVLAHGEGDQVTIGAPLVEGASVTAEIVDQGRARTVIAFKKRRRQNSRRRHGHRQHETTVRIDEILAAGAKPAKRTEKKAEPKAEAVETGAAKAEAVKAEVAPPEAAQPEAKPVKKAAPKKAEAKTAEAKKAEPKKAAPKKAAAKTEKE
jgi:large subunit ribosomal protein L21